MANQKFSVEEILKEYQSDEATKGKKESPSGKLETQKMLNHAAGRRNVPPSTEASAEAYSYASSRTRQRTPYSPYRSEMAANINQIKQNRYQRRTDVEESRTAAFQTLELMRPKVSFVRSPAIRPQTTPNPKSDHISDYDGAVLLEQPESEQKPEQPVYQPAIQEMQDSTRAKEKKQAQKSRKPKKRTEQSYQRESLTEPEPEWRKAKTETFPAITPTQTLQETLREAQEAVAKAEAEAAAAVAALKAEQQQPQKKQPISHAFETLLTSPAKQQEKTAKATAGEKAACCEKMVFWEETSSAGQSCSTIELSRACGGVSAANRTAAEALYTVCAKSGRAKAVYTACAKIGRAKALYTASTKGRRAEALYTASTKGRRAKAVHTACTKGRRAKAVHTACTKSERAEVLYITCTESGRAKAVHTTCAKGRRAKAGAKGRRAEAVHTASTKGRRAKAVHTASTKGRRAKAIHTASTKGRRAEAIHTACAKICAGSTSGFYNIRTG